MVPAIGRLLLIAFGKHYLHPAHRDSQSRVLVAVIWQGNASAGVHPEASVLVQIFHPPDATCSHWPVGGRPQGLTQIASELCGQFLNLLGRDRWPKDAEQHAILNPHDAAYLAARSEKPRRFSDWHHLEGMQTWAGCR
jgi:hypothetical protein